MSLELLELARDVTGLALNLESDNVGAVLFGEWDKIEEGDQVKRSGRGFRNLNNYRLRILLAGGANPLRETHPVTSIRPRRPRLVA